MKFNIIIGEILKRIKLNKFVFNNRIARDTLLFPVKNNNISLKDAKEILSNFSPKPKSSSYTKNNVNQLNYDLKIIVPAYNAEKYIDECISSILSQETEYSYVVVIINDGSNDKTRELLKVYENDTRVKVIDQQNKGFSGARNTGLQNIDSKYLMFVDSDDKLETNAIQLLLSSAFKNDSDIVEGSFYKFRDNKILNKNIHMDNPSVNPFGNLTGYPWGKVIRSSLFYNMRFPEGYWYEDTIFLFLIFPQCKKATTISDFVYWYRHNAKGISMSSKRKKKSIDTYWITEQMLEDMDKFKIQQSQDIYDAILSQIYLNFRRTKYMPEEIKKSIFILSANILQKQFKNCKTNNKRFIELESALRNNDYKKYLAYCILF